MCDCYLKTKPKTTPAQYSIQLRCFLITATSVTCSISYARQVLMTSSWLKHGFFHSQVTIKSAWILVYLRTIFRHNCTSNQSPREYFQTYFMFLMYCDKYIYLECFHYHDCEIPFIVFLLICNEVSNFIFIFPWSEQSDLSLMQAHV